MATNRTKQVSTLRVGRLFATPGRRPPNYGATVRIDNGVIVGVKTAGRIDDVRSGRHLVAMPALANAHDHGRGLHHVAFGAKDQQFELWRPALYAHPPVDPYLNAALAYGRLARAGVGSGMHVHSSILVHRLIDDAEAICRAARDVGIRLAFVVPLRDKQSLGHADDEELIALHDPRDHDTIRQTWLYDFPPPDEYMQLVKEIARRVEGPTISVQYGPNSPQACTDALLERIAASAAADGRRVTTHFLETRVQRQWADATYPQGFVKHLDQLGVLSERFTGAHGVWLRPDDVDLLAERGAQIAVNTSSNLRLRSGIAPVAQYIKSGMRFSFGIDSFSFDDDDDAFREMRVGHWLHSLNQSDAPLATEKLFEGWHRNAFYAVNNSDDYGEVKAGAPADLVVLDYDAMAYDIIEGMAEELDIILTRAGNRYIDRVIVAGREIVRGGKVLGIDMDAVEKEVLAQARAAGDDMRQLKPVLDRSTATLDEFYRSGKHAAQ